MSVAAAAPGADAATAPNAAAPGTLVLPSSLVTRMDLARLVREVEAVDNDLETQKVRGQARARETGAAAGAAGAVASGGAAGQTAYRLPNVSRALAEFLETNHLDIGDDHARQACKEKLRVMKDKAPVVHLTFAVEADPASLQYLAGWLREQIHPQALLSVGLQPSLVGGVYLRTPSHVHDFSLRALLAGKRDVIRHELEGLLASAMAQTPAAAVVAVAPEPAAPGAAVGAPVAPAGANPAAAFAPQTVAPPAVPLDADPTAQSATAASQPAATLSPTPGGTQ